MAEQPENEARTNGSNSAQDRSASAPEELVKVIDRRGRVKEIPRSKYEQQKRTRKKHSSRKKIHYGNLLSILLILAIMIIAIYIALKIVQ